MRYDGVDEDAVLGSVNRQSPGQRDDSALRSGIVGLTGATQYRGRRDVDNPAPSEVAHCTQAVLGAKERPTQVYVDHGMPLLVRHLGWRAVREVPGVVDDDVELRKGILDLHDRRLPLVPLTHVQGDMCRLPARVRDRIGDASGALPVDVCDADCGTVLSQADRCRLADS
jgi:hypothetical protein